MQFAYWDLLRKGKTQVEIAQMYRVSRQAINKTVKAQNHKVMTRLLELARSIGALVEWQDETKGVLVGIVPQLEDRICIILVNSNNLEKVFYKNISDTKWKFKQELIKNIKDTLDISMSKDSTFEEILESLVNS
jgi:DNA-binding XRE family transcriptional regulator